jgi:hypothetical protein
MPSKEKNVHKKSRGRPPGSRYAGNIPCRLPPTVLALLDEFAARQKVSRSEAIRRLLETALTTTRAATSVRKKTTAADASEMVGATSDRLGDKSAPADGQANRKRTLIKGRSELREMRDDLPKRKR